MAATQLELPLHSNPNRTYKGDLKEKLVALLSENLDFQGKVTAHASHTFHPFPAKFPPQLPEKFIHHLTKTGDFVLDPMMGSGTTIMEAFVNNRIGIGADIDPLAILISLVKTCCLDKKVVFQKLRMILENSRKKMKEKDISFKNMYNQKTKEFIDYWFSTETQLELIVLINEISKIPEPPIKAFFLLAFSGIIITKSGGVSLAFDLAHTRPHRAKEFIYASEKKTNFLLKNYKKRDKFHTKLVKSAIDEFEKRCKQNIAGIVPENNDRFAPLILSANAQKLPLLDETIDLIVTSPPYASNAIDYMRAHKFTLVWFGHIIEKLGQKRKTYIGGESVTDIQFEQMPESVQETLNSLWNIDTKKGKVLHRYFSEMKRVLREIFRVLKPETAAIVVVGNSVIKGVDTKTPQCLSEIGMELGFEVPSIGIRNIDRNKRMLPAGRKLNLESQIQKRMHKEYVIGFYKP